MMFTKFKNALINAVSGTDTLEYGEIPKAQSAYKYQYNRPTFLNFNEEEINAASDSRVRPLILPRDVTFPFSAGYCECINAGKSKHNEDQAAYWYRTIEPNWFKNIDDSNMETFLNQPPRHSSLPAVPSQPYDINHSSFTDLSFIDSELGQINDSHFNLNKESDQSKALGYTCFAIFDGHGGPMVAVKAARELEGILHSKLEEVIDSLLPNPNPVVFDTERNKGGMRYQLELRKPPKPCQLIVGALETSFREMDQRIGEDKDDYGVKGGCTALLVLCIMGKIYTACAGDSRAIVAVGNSVEALSKDHTPTSERFRICNLGYQRPVLLKSDYTAHEYYKRPTVEDLGKPVLYRNPQGCGFSYRIVSTEDLKMPLVSGVGKRARLMGTIGVTRGFGDHELKSLGSTISIKPFLSPVPDIKILDVRQLDLTPSDVIIMGSDGLFDVTTNKQAANVVRKSFSKMTNTDDRKYTCAAQDLVNYARGKPANESRSWRKNDGEPASGDDISAWVIPLLPYQHQFNEWIVKFQDYDFDSWNCFKLKDRSTQLPINNAHELLYSDNEEDSDLI